MSATIDSDTSNEHYRITLEKTGSTKGTIRVRSWPRGTNPDASGPAKDDTYRLIEIRAAADGSRIVCKADVFPFFRPAVTCTVNGPAAGAPASVEVDVAGHDDKYPIDQADHDEIKAFIVGAHFPALN